MAQHARFSIDTGIAVYICDPHSPRQRGTVENSTDSSAILPRGADLLTTIETDRDLVADELNQCPRRTRQLPDTRRSRFAVYSKGARSLAATMSLTSAVSATACSTTPPAATTSWTIASRTSGTALVSIPQPAQARSE